MADTVLIPPGSDPISLAWAKSHSRVFVNADDSIIRDQYIPAAVSQVENDTGRLFLGQTRKLFLDRFPRVIYIPKNPVRALVAIDYIDQNGNAQSFSLANVSTDTTGEYFRIIPADGQQWPIPGDIPGAVQITYRAGYAVPVSVNSSTDTFTSTNHDLQNGDAVRPLVFGGDLPAGLPSGVYYVINRTDDTFQLSATSGGSAVDMSDTGTGTLLICNAEGHPFYLRMTQALLILAAHWYENREPVIIGTISSQTPLSYSMIVDSLSRSLL